MTEEPDFPLRKQQIEAQMADYTREIGAYAAFMERWRSLHSPAARRVERFRRASKPVTEAAE